MISDTRLDTAASSPTHRLGKSGESWPAAGDRRSAQATQAAHHDHYPRTGNYKRNALHSHQLPGRNLNKIFCKPFTLPWSIDPLLNSWNNRTACVNREWAGCRLQWQFSHKPGRRMKHYRQLAQEKRYQIAVWKELRLDNSEVTRRPDRSSGTIGRELRRNSAVKGYQPGWRNGFQTSAGRRPTAIMNQSFAESKLSPRTGLRESCPMPMPGGPKGGATVAQKAPRSMGPPGPLVVFIFLTGQERQALASPYTNVTNNRLFPRVQDAKWGVNRLPNSGRAWLRDRLTRVRWGLQVPNMSSALSLKFLPYLRQAQLFLARAPSWPRLRAADRPTASSAWRSLTPALAATGPRSLPARRTCFLMALKICSWL